MSFTAERVTATIGAVLEGVSLATCSDDEFESVSEALHEHQVVFVRGAHLTPDEQLSVARRLGTPSIYPLARLRGVTEPALQSIEDGPDSPPTAEIWHTDVSWTETPPGYAVLCGVTIPPYGGDTLWASMFEAYDELSAPIRTLVDGLVGEHTTESIVESILQRGKGSPEAHATVERLHAAYPQVLTHPIVRTHPVSGRRALFLGGQSLRRIRGLAARESDALLGMLRAHVADERFQCRWRWQEGDVAIWDERSTMHRAAADHFPQRRHVRRVEVDGDRPYFDPAVGTRPAAA
ncbi:TauD/TfdA dioxygenase family protein [Tomitella gaofuii]|uniref:TauD/TfdA dioxygenase family protein n=1 Tax=Tomitella gaofuii TaxID=2760083 RepID=UPI0015FC1633|nr:TauD/TfdA family dioxygenase [Tomitella gaofuii]